MTGFATAGPFRRRRWHVGLSLLAGLIVPVALAADPWALPARGLSGLLAVEVEYRAHKLIFSSDTKAGIELTSPDSVREALEAAPLGTPVPLPDTVAKLTVETDLPFGRREVVRILLDPRTGGALQAERVVTGRGPERILTRYLNEGIYVWRSSPADRREEKLRPDLWTDRRERFSPYPADLPKDAVVTDGYALVPLAEAARLDRPGARLRLYVLSRRGLLALEFTPQGLASREVELEEQSPSTRRVRSGPELVRLVQISAHGVSGGEAATPDDLRVLGFKGAVTLAVDAATGVPVAITGRADYIGTLTAELVRVRYAYDPPSR